MTMRRAALVALAMTGALLAGCGSDDSDTDTEPTTSAEETTDSDQEEAEDDGERVGTDDFTFVLPEGWEDLSDQASAPVVLQYADPSTADGGAVPTNVNVLILPAGDLSVAELEDAAVAELEGAGIFTDVTVEDRAELDGVDAAVVSSGAEQSGEEYEIRQYFGEYEGDRYVITFTFTGGTDEDEQMELAESAMDTWRWEN